jgi:hypothetical protein
MLIRPATSVTLAAGSMVNLLPGFFRLFSAVSGGGALPHPFRGGCEGGCAAEKRSQNKAGIDPPP